MKRIKHMELRNFREKQNHFRLNLQLNVIVSIPFHSFVSSFLCRFVSVCFFLLLHVKVFGPIFVFGKCVCNANKNELHSMRYFAHFQETIILSHVFVPNGCFYEHSKCIGIQSNKVPFWRNKKEVKKKETNNCENTMGTIQYTYNELLLFRMSMIVQKVQI